MEGSKHTRLSGSNRLTTRQVEVILDCLHAPHNQITFETFNQHSVLDNAISKLSSSVYNREGKKYAHLGPGNRMTGTQGQRLLWFLERVLSTYRRSNPQVHRVLGNAIGKLKSA